MPVLQLTQQEERWIFGKDDFLISYFWEEKKKGKLSHENNADFWHRYLQEGSLRAALQKSEESHGTTS